VEALCRRVILIDRSRVRYDGELGSLAAKLSPGRLIDENPPLELVLDRFYRDAER
jgi:ABC-2 type transport system ATP-binding protein